MIPVAVYTRTLSPSISHLFSFGKISENHAVHAQWYNALAISFELSGNSRVSILNCFPSGKLMKHQFTIYVHDFLFCAELVHFSTTCRLVRTSQDLRITHFPWTHPTLCDPISMMRDRGSLSMISRLHDVMRKRKMMGRIENFIIIHTIGKMPISVKWKNEESLLEWMSSCFSLAILALYHYPSSWRRKDPGTRNYGFFVSLRMTNYSAVSV